ncbi:MAG: PD40 domain-containing protein [Acidobacteria bacterium]|nr:PD40 domain-containing protein [Acidobacteriota bacterium]
MRTNQRGSGRRKKGIRGCLFGACLVLLFFAHGGCGSGKLPDATSPPPSPFSAGLIVFVGPDASGQSQVFTVQPDGSERRQLTRAPGGHAFPAWSRDGKRIAFTSLRTGAVEIWVMNVDGTDQTQLTFPPASGNFVPSWSPNGNQIAFASVRTGHSEIWVMNADGTNQRQLTSTATPGGSNAPSWSPDGTKIAFASDSSGLTHVHVMDADGSNIRQLTQPIGTNFPDSNVPVWAPDSSKLSFWSGIETRFGQVWVIDGDGGNRRVLSDCPPPTNCDNPAWSPDGRQILFETNRGGPLETWVMNADGSNPRQLFPFPYGAGRLPWQPVPGPGLAGIAGAHQRASIRMTCGQQARPLAIPPWSKILYWSRAETERLHGLTDGEPAEVEVSDSGAGAKVAPVFGREPAGGKLLDRGEGLDLHVAAPKHDGLAERYFEVEALLGEPHRHRDPRMLSITGSCAGQQGWRCVHPAAECLLLWIAAFSQLGCAVSDGHTFRVRETSEESPAARGAMGGSFERSTGL